MALVTGDEIPADQIWAFYAQKNNHSINVFLPALRKQSKISVNHNVHFIDDSDSTRIKIFADLAANVLRSKAVLASHFKYADYLHTEIAMAQFAVYCYAFVFLNLDDNSWPVEGQLAWVTAAFYRLRGLNNLYLFDLRANCWMQIAYKVNQWTATKCTPPTPTGQYLGRAASNADQNQIIDALKKFL